MTQTAPPTRAAARKLPLHQRIIWARKRKGISQERLAEQIGTSRRHMIRVEKGQHRPGPALRARIAAATEQPEAFFDDAEDEEADRAVVRAAAEGLVSALLSQVRRETAGEGVEVQP